MDSAVVLEVFSKKKKSSRENETPSLSRRKDSPSRLKETSLFLFLRKKREIRTLAKLGAPK